MRKSTIILALTLVLISCTSENEFVLQEYPTTVPELKKRSLSEVLDIAKNATSLLGHESRSAESRTIDLENIQYVCTNKKSRSQSSDTLLYVINYTDNNGFAVVSANPNTTGLIAVTETGTYTSDFKEENKNSGISLFMDLAEMYVSKANYKLDGGLSGVIKELIEETDTIDTWIEPKVSVSWGQTGHEGKFCPNGISGCSITALGQIMTYFEHPSQMNITYENAPVSVLNLNWSEIKKYKNTFDDTATNAVHNAIGHLCRQLGELANSKYYESSTSTTTTEAMNTISTLGYTVSSNLMDYNNTSFLSTLSNNNLVYMRGDRLIDNNTTVGHAWIVDGHFERVIHNTIYTRELGSTFMELFDESYVYYNYNHINWGYDGSCNGYFLKNVFDTYNAIEYDGTYNYLNRNYNLNLKYFLITK